MSGHRRLVTAATLSVGVLVLGVMAVVGLKTLTAPIDNGPKATTGPRCPVEEQVSKTHVRRGEVTVSIFNAGGEQGQAQETLVKLEEAGFKAGAVGNAPDGITVDRAEVYAGSTDDAGALLVAKILGRNVKVVQTDEEYGPGVDVFIGKRLGKLNRKAPRRIKLREPVITCAR